MGCGASRATQGAVAPGVAGDGEIEHGDASDGGPARVGDAPATLNHAQISGVANADVATQAVKSSGQSSNHQLRSAATEQKAGVAQHELLAEKNLDGMGNDRQDTAAPQAPALPSGRVAGAISTIVNYDDDVFLADGAAPESAGTSAAMPSRHTQQPERATSNPLSESVQANGQPAQPIQLQQPNRLASLDKGSKTQDKFSDITGPRSHLPGVESFSRRPPPTNWLAPSALDQLGTANSSALEPLAAPQHTEVLELGDCSDIGRDLTAEEDEELDSFDVHAISSPQFDSPVRREQPPVKDLGLSDILADPEDPWEMLQQQYKIRDNMQSPTALRQHGNDGRSGSKWDSSPLLAREEVLVLDEDDGLTAAMARPPVQLNEQNMNAAPDFLGAPRAVRKEGNWGDGDMAQAGDLMLGRGALDSGPSGYVDQQHPSFNGNGQYSSLSPGYDEYQENDKSFDLSTLEVPPVQGNASLDIAMEDFNDDLETYGVSKGGKELSLADKLAQFESAGDDGDLDEDEYLINEELRLFAQNSP